MCQCSALTCGHIQLRGESIPIRIHMSFLIYLVAILAPAAQISSTYFLFCFLLYGVIQTTTVLIHEMGHAYAALRLQCSVGQILLWPLGGICYIGRGQRSSLSPKEDIIIACSGPAVHIPLALLYYVLYLYTADKKLSNGILNEREEYLSIFSNYDSTCNFYVTIWNSCMTNLLMKFAFLMQILLFIFNFFTPAFPLDGGRILFSSLLLCGCSKSCTAKIMGCTSAFIGILLITYGISLSADSVYVLTGGLIQVFIGFYCLSKGYQLFASSFTSSEHELPEFQNAPIVYLQTNRNEV